MKLLTAHTSVLVHEVWRGNGIYGHASVFPHLMSRHSRIWSNSCPQCLELGPWEDTSSFTLSNRERPCEAGRCLIENLNMDPQMWSNSCPQCLELGPWEDTSSFTSSNRERPCEAGRWLIEDVKIIPQDRILLHWAAEVGAKVFAVHTSVLV